jgi:malate synthase
LFDFALYFYHNVHCLLGKGTRPYFYLPKLVCGLECLCIEMFAKVKRGS